MASKYMTLEGGKMVLKPLDDIPVEALTEFEAFASDNNQSTTTNGWATKSGYPYTTDIKSAGQYVVDFTAEIGQSDKFKQVGFRVQWRLFTSGAWNTLSVTKNGVSTDGEYALRSGFRLINLPVTTNFQVRLQWGQTDDGGSGFIKNAGIKIGKVAE